MKEPEKTINFLDEETPSFLDGKPVILPDYEAVAREAAEAAAKGELSWEDLEDAKIFEAESKAEAVRHQLEEAGFWDQQNDGVSNPPKP